MAEKIRYIAESTLRDLHASDAFYRGIRGPVRSGKSTGCSWELWRRGQEQKPNRQGIKKTRFAVIRNTYRELEDTTLKTWLDWFSEDRVGPFNRQKMSHHIRTKTLDMEVLFRALDRPSDIVKLLSMELTGAWINEAREIPKAVVDTIGDRVGQYPSKKDGGCTWWGVIMDTNSPDEDHWWYGLAEENTPDNWVFFSQPGGLIESDGKFLPNPAAENISNLNEGYEYYLSRIGGKSKDYVRVYYCNQYGFVQDGKPVHPEYVDATHCSQETLKPIKNLPIYVGLDFGLTPAAEFAQRLHNGRWVFIDELCATDMGTKRFGTELVRFINENYPGFEFDFWGDPAGDIRSETDEETPYRILRSLDIPAKPCHTNDTTIRREAMQEPLMRMIDGQPGLLVSQKCKMLRKGLAGGFCYRRVQISGDERYHDKPDKNMYSHPVEAAEYLLVGAGEGRRLITPMSKPVFKMPPSIKPMGRTVSRIRAMR